MVDFALLAALAEFLDVTSLMDVVVLRHAGNKGYRINVNVSYSNRKPVGILCKPKAKRGGRVLLYWPILGGLPTGSY